MNKLLLAATIGLGILSLSTIPARVADAPPPEVLTTAKTSRLPAQVRTPAVVLATYRLPAPERFNPEGTVSFEADFTTADYQRLVQIGFERYEMWLEEYNDFD